MDEEQQSVRSCCGLSMADSQLKDRGFAEFGWIVTDYPGLRVQFVPVGKCMPSCFRSQHQLFEPGFEPRKKSL